MKKASNYYNKTLKALTFMVKIRKHYIASFRHFISLSISGQQIVQNSLRF